MLDTDLSVLPEQKELLKKFVDVRERTEAICRPLQKEDFVSQPIVDVSPPKWHLAHTTWFFETFILNNHATYKCFDENYSFLFNSYYNTVGERVKRYDRGKITRPGVDEVMEYREYVNDHIKRLIESNALDSSDQNLLELGLQHEMQHQELLFYDIKYILGINPINPVYDNNCTIDRLKDDSDGRFLPIDEGVYEIGFEGDEFCFDNEKGRHRVFLEKFEISNRLVLNGDYLEFIEDGGYKDYRHWHSDAWDWLQKEDISAPLYWKKLDGRWHRFTLSGLAGIDPKEVLMHLSFYEASAFANWKGLRLPTEFEWEVASDLFNWGNCWEWTNSAYLPYPYYKAPPGAVGEYNGKFMVNQMVLKGSSKATYPNHSRKTYRNFFHPHLRWQFAGIRLAKNT